MNELKAFTLRVYALIRHESNVLISHENYQGRSFVKFPGGGVQLGEGLVEALRRELEEEMGQELVNHDLLYCTESFQQSSFHPDQQVIAVYYLVEVNNAEKIKTGIEEGAKESFVWVNESDLHTDILTFESDKAALQKYLSAI